MAALLALPPAGLAVTAGPSSPVAAGADDATHTARIRPVTVPAVAGRSAELSVDTTGGAVARAVWSFGDTHTGSGVDVSHAWAKPGSYATTATVTFADRAVVTASLPIAVIPPPPATPRAVFTYDLGGPSVSVTGQPGSGSGPVTSWDLRVRGPKATGARPHGADTWYVEHHDCGLYTYALTAYGPGGSATWTSPSVGKCAVPAPAAPVQAKISGPRGARVLAVSWQPADNTDRLVVDGYDVTVDPGGGDIALTGLGTAITLPLPFGIGCGTVVTVSVAGFNAAGTGPRTTVSAPNTC